MSNEFKKINHKKETRYVLETASAGATSAGAVASNPAALGKVIKRKMENLNHARLDHEIEMAREDLYHLTKQAIELQKILSNVSELQGLEGWQQAKITKAADYINSVFKSLNYQDDFDTELEGVAGGLAGGAIGAAITKSPSGAISGYKIGSAAQDLLSNSSKINEAGPTSIFLKTLHTILQQMYPNTKFMLKSDRVASKDSQLDVIAGEHEEGNYVGVALWDVATGPYKGALGQAIKQTTEQLLQANPGKKPALFIVGDNQNPEAWNYIANKLGYRLVTDEDESLEDEPTNQVKEVSADTLTKYISSAAKTLGDVDDYKKQNRAKSMSKAAAKLIQKPDGKDKLEKHRQNKDGFAAAANEGLKDPKDNPCWSGYHPVGTKTKNGRTVPNCVPKKKMNQ